MLADPVTVTAASPTPELTLAIIKQDGYGSERKDGPNGYTVVTNHQYLKGGGDKHYVQMTSSLIAVDPISGASSKQVASVSLTIVRPKIGFNDTAMVALTTALHDYVFDSQVTPAKLLQFQS
jgi:hypothetical protein